MSEINIKVEVTLNDSETTKLWNTILAWVDLRSDSSEAEVEILVEKLMGDAFRRGLEH